MAVITIRVPRGAGSETKRRLAQALTAAASETLAVPHSDITVLIEEYAGENWAVGGELQSDRGRPEAMAYDLEALFKKPASRPVEPALKSAAKVKASPRKAAAKSRSRR